MNTTQIKINFTKEFNGKTLEFKNVSIDRYTTHDGDVRFYTPMKGVSSVVRQFMKQHFPEVGTFQISSDSYSMGDSVTVYLNEVDKELHREVKSTLDSLFQYGRFNGMQDIYECKDGEMFSTEIEGKVVEFSTKYMFVNNTPKYGTKAWEEYQNRRNQ